TSRPRSRSSPTASSYPVPSNRFGNPANSDRTSGIEETMSQPAVIQVDGLVKNFGHVRALDGLDLQITEGEIHGFLGPNGAGKSTTIRVLLGLLRADSGTAQLFGRDP